MPSMPRYAFEPYVRPCEVDGCDRQAMNSTTWICRMHYMRRWRERHPDYQRRWQAANPDKVAEYRARYAERQRHAE
jgi:hypothetical protein